MISQYIWFNSYIKVNSNVIFYEKPYKEGLKYIGQLVDTNGKRIPTEIICMMFEITIMEYNSLWSAIP